MVTSTCCRGVVLVGRSDRPPKYQLNSFNISIFIMLWLGIENVIKLVLLQSMFFRSFKDDFYNYLFAHVICEGRKFNKCFFTGFEDF